MMLKVIKMSFYCLMVFVVVFLLEFLSDFICNRIGDAAKYESVYNIPQTDISMKICRGARDSCTLIYLMHRNVLHCQEDPEVLQVRKSRNGPSKHQKRYCDIQLFFTQSDVCYVSCLERWREKTVSLITIDKKKQSCGFSFDFNNPGIYSESCTIRDSSKVTVFLRNDLKTVIVAYNGSLYGEYLAPCKEKASDNTLCSSGNR
jgi:hypothetical protein